jgi:hypothetical protein
MLPLALVFLLPILSGALLVHLFWPDRDPVFLLLKFFLGIGVGLGLSSLQYFVYLFFFAGQTWFIAVELATFFALLLAAVSADRKRTPGTWPRMSLPGLTRAQRILVGAGLLVFMISLASTASYLLRRRQGDWDAWMMYNRAARFVYRDQPHWLQSFSARMDPIFHADYPLLLAMNIASSWETLGVDTPHVPMLQSGLFAVACVGLFMTALAAVKSPGQAALGLVILWGTPVFVNEGAREMADVPLAFYILATGILFYLFVLRRRAGLLVLAGLTAGLAAWTKNEGDVFVIAALVALTIAFFHEQRGRPVLSYLLGLVVPLAIVLYFKVFLAPPSDVLSSGPVRSLQQILDISRHVEILRALWLEITSFGSWGIMPFSVGVIVILTLYYVLFRSPVPRELRPAYVAGRTMLIIQALGYYGIYLITPYDLAWHLSFSTTRVLIQVFPVLVFLILSASRVPESILDSKFMDSEGVNHASRN